jgi:hypothetical protein
MVHVQAVIGGTNYEVFLPDAMLDASPLMPCCMKLRACRLTSDHPDLRDKRFSRATYEGLH